MLQTPASFYVPLPPASASVRVTDLYPHFELGDSRENWINTPGARQGRGVCHSASVHCLLLQRRTRPWESICLFPTFGCLGVFMHFIAKVPADKPMKTPRLWRLRKHMNFSINVRCRFFAYKYKHLVYNCALCPLIFRRKCVIPGVSR